MKTIQELRADVYAAEEAEREKAREAHKAACVPGKVCQKCGHNHKYHKTAFDGGYDSPCKACGRAQECPWRPVTTIYRVIDNGRDCSDWIALCGACAKKRTKAFLRTK